MCRLQVYQVPQDVLISVITGIISGLLASIIFAGVMHWRQRRVTFKREKFIMYDLLITLIEKITQIDIMIKPNSDNLSDEVIKEIIEIKIISKKLHQGNKYFRAKNAYFKNLAEEQKKYFNYDVEDLFKKMHETTGFFADIDVTSIKNKDDVKELRQILKGKAATCRRIKMKVYEMRFKKYM